MRANDVRLRAPNPSQEIPSSFIPRALTALALTLPALAQSFEPAPEVAKFHHFIGQFEGGGKFVPAPGMDPADWTSTANGQLVLGGHYVQLDEKVATPIGPLEFRTLYGWDRERSEVICVSVGSMGASKQDVTWIDGKLVSTYSSREEGVPFAERAITEVTAEGYQFSMERLSGLDGSFKHVWGRVKRTSTEPAPARESSVDTPADTLAPLAPLVGNWNLKGSVTMMGMEMDITATEAVEWRYGGLVLSGSILGQPGDYQGQWYMAWDPNTESFTNIVLSSMGEFSIGTARREGDQIITTSERTMEGVPMVERSIVQLSKAGVVSVSTDLMIGGGDTLRAFEATYERAPGAKQVSFKAGSCCDKAEKAGGACAHPCCVKAAAEGKVCERCNG